jgi:hypothetical protein
MAVSSMECISALTRSTWAQYDASGTANWRPALPEVPCVSKMQVMIDYLESFLGVSPFLQSRDSSVYARMDVLYRDKKLDEVDDEACIKYVVRKMLAWYTKFPPKNDEAAAAVETSAPAPPPRIPDSPGATTNGPRPKRCMALSNDESEAAKVFFNKRALQAFLSGPWKERREGGFLSRSMLRNTLSIMLHSIVYDMLYTVHT